MELLLIPYQFSFIIWLIKSGAIKTSLFTFPLNPLDLRNFLYLLAEAYYDPRKCLRWKALRQ